MSKLTQALVLAFVLLVGSAGLAQAQVRSSATPSATPKVSGSPVATVSVEATPSAELATASATIQEFLQQKTDQDITNVKGETKEKLVEWLDMNPVGPLSWHNFLAHAIRRAINNGLPANIIVLILLFPLITSIISFSRHVIGLKGFGVYTPAVLSVAFVSTGVVNGIILFLIVLSTAMLMRLILRRLNLQALPRTAMLLWGVSIMVLLFLVGVSFIPSNALISVSIFPLLIIILLTENFMESQLVSSQSEAQQLTLETLFTAVVCSLLIGAEVVQRYVILQPELTLISVAAFNLIVGRYAGLRLMEWIRFRAVID